MELNLINKWCKVVPQQPGPSLEAKYSSRPLFGDMNLLDKKLSKKKTTNKHYIVCNITTNTRHIFDIAFCIWGMPSSIHIWKFSFLDGMLQYISFQSPLSILKPTSTPFSLFLSYLIVKVDNKSIAWMYWTWWLKERSLSLKEHHPLFQLRFDLKEEFLIRRLSLLL